MSQKMTPCGRFRVVRGAFRPRGVRWRPFVVEKTGSTNRLWRGSGPSGEWLLKWYRYPQTGVHPESEVSQFLNEQHFEGVAEFGGRLDSNGTRDGMTLAFVQRWLHGRSVWEKTVEAMRAGLNASTLARTLGRSVGRLHRALGSGGVGSAFCQDRWSPGLQKAWTRRISASLRRLETVSCGECPAGLDERQWKDSKILCLNVIHSADQRLKELEALMVGGEAIRIHGDLHLGQILEVSSGLESERYVMLDFEGEPARPVAERRAKDSPLRDVAGVFRSFAYAGAVSGVSSEIAEAWSCEFLEGWTGVMSLPSGNWRSFLDGLMWEKAIYEAEYELRHRPDWLWIPLKVLAEGL